MRRLVSIVVAASCALQTAHAQVFGSATQVSPAANAPGGSSGQEQYNSGGVLSGFTMNGDASMVTSTGAITVSKTAGVAFGPLATAAAPTTCAGVGQQLQWLGAAWSCVLVSGTTFLAARATGVNVTATGDQAAGASGMPITLTGPNSAAWTVVRAVITNCSAGSGSWTASFRSAASGGGSVVLGGQAQAFANGLNSAAARIVLPSQTLSSSNYAMSYPSGTTSGSLYFNVVTAGSGTCEVDVYGQVL